MSKPTLLSLAVPLLMAAARAVSLPAPAPAADPAEAQPLARSDTTCAPVTFVTRPVAIMRADSLPERYTPTTVPLCPGSHAVRFRGTGLDTVWVTIEVASDTPQHHLVRVPCRGVR